MEQAYKDIYTKHVNNLKQFHARSEAHGILPSMLKKIDKNGWYVSHSCAATLLTHACSLHVKVAMDVEDCLADDLGNDAIDAAIQEFEEGNGHQSEDDM